MRFEGDANFPRNSLASHVVEWNMGCLGTYRQTCGLRIARARLVTAELCGGGGEEERADGPRKLMEPEDLCGAL